MRVPADGPPRGAHPLDTAADLLVSLFLPFAEGDVDAGALAGALFARARAGAWQARWPALACMQTFRPWFEALERSGARVANADAWPATRTVLVLPPRQRDEARALFARAVRHVGEGGLVVACQANADGARSSEADLARLAGPVQTRSKHKCRVFWARIDALRAHDPLVDAWCALDAPQAIAGGGWTGRRGLFSWDRVDPASRLLAEHLDVSVAGRVADLGAGWGYLASELVRRCPRVEAIDLYEAEQRACAPALANVARACADVGRAVAHAFHWHDVAAGVPGGYDAIVSNPPFHQGRADDPGLGRAFIRAAASALAAHGTVRLVANRHLPYEAVLGERFGRVRVVAERDGFKLFEARGPVR